ncbi:Uncharacterised protein [Mycobacterium tuberculosis]|nr:Uncharacterised protein [Mycobacterium tuberculosis]
MAKPSPAQQSISASFGMSPNAITSCASMPWRAANFSRILPLFTVLEPISTSGSPTTPRVTDTSEPTA